MSERPILFSGPMVRAILAGTKTQTRRVVKLLEGFEPSGSTMHWPHAQKRAGVTVPLKCPYGQPGDRLWVRETWAPVFKRVPHSNGCLYRADDDGRQINPRSMDGKWKPSIHMPRWASRLTLEMTSVRVEQLKDISEEDAKAEGAVFTDWGKHCHTLSCDGGETWGHVHTQKAGWHFGDASSHEHCLGTARMAFANIWNHVYGVDAWDRNEWVWAISFKRASP
jgi:hypothetical protein